MEPVIGIDIGGTKCAVILGQADEKDIKVIKRVAFPTASGARTQETIDRILSEVDKMMGECGAGDGPRRAGISCGGPLDTERGIILSPPNLPGWDHIPIVDILEERFPLKARLQNDADACALAEWKYGAGAGTRNMVFLTFGTGMGAGLILGGRLYDGTCGTAGEIGHVRLSEHGPVGYGKSGSFEGFCSGGGIAQIAKVKVLEKLQMGEHVAFCGGVGELDRLDAKRVGDAAEAGDPLAQEIYGICARYLGYGLSILIDLLNPEVIVIGSIFARSRGLLWPRAKQIIDAEALRAAAEACRVVPAALGERLGDYAALSAAL